MRAAVITGFGGPEVFELRDLPKPQPGANELLVKVHAASVNPVDTKIRQAGAWAGQEPPAVIGYDVSGVVEAVGPSVFTFEVGDEVFYTPYIFGKPGSYAEYHVADAVIAARKPAHLTHEEAASLPLAGGTAWDALIARGGLRVGETVLIHGCGGVGSLAVQIAKAAGAQVLVTCSDVTLELAKELGADQAIRYKTGDFVEVVNDRTQGKGVDLVLDTVGGDLLARSVAATKPFGRMVGIVDIAGSLGDAFMKNITLHFFFLQREAYKLNELGKLIERGQLKPVIDSVMPLDEVARAHQRLEEGGVKGKIVLKVAR